MSLSNTVCRLLYKQTPLLSRVAHRVARLCSPLSARLRIFIRSSPIIVRSSLLTHTVVLYVAVFSSSLLPPPRTAL